MGVMAFTPMGNTVTFIAASTAPTPVQATSTTGSANQYLVQNPSAQTVFLGVGVAAANATANSANVTTTGAAIPLLPSTTQVFSFVPGAYFTGTASANSTVYITPGDGI
jgi:hypothetical protein